MIEAMVDHVIEPGVGIDAPLEESFPVLDGLLKRLVKRTGADHAMVGELAGADRDRIAVHRLISHGSVASVFDYALAGTPCEDVMSSGTVIVPRDVAELYPQDTILAEMKMQGYAGIPLIGEGDRPQGILVLMFEQPISSPEEVKQALEHRGVRVAMELERIRFEARLARSERRYRLLVDNARDGIVAHRDFQLLFVNPAAARLLGYGSATEAMAIGNLLELLPPHEQERVTAMNRMRDEEHPPERDYDIDALHKDGHAVRLRTLVSRLEWEDGLQATQLVVWDATARQEADAKAQQAKRLEAIGKLTGGIAHDFNNLLAVVLGNLELASDQLADSDVKELLAQSMVAAERGAELTRRLLSFARRQPLKPRSVALGKLFDETRELLQRTLSADIKLAIREDSGAPVMADPTQLQTALLNLAINSRDAMSGRGRLEINAYPVTASSMRARFADALSAAHICIEVADSGKGMSPETRERAFEPFFSTKNEGQGSGLGLSMVHGFIRQSRGQVEIESFAGAGTRVKLYLPVAQSAPTLEVVSVSEPVTSPASGRILVVEDERTVREVTVAMLRSFGYEVFAAADGAAARGVLEREAVDLLLSDVVLPGERGPEIAAEALQRQPDLRVMFMSGYAETEVFRSFGSHREVTLLQKPFRRAALRDRVAEVMAAAPVARTQ